MLTWTWTFILEMPCSLALLVLVTYIIVRLGGEGGGIPSKPLENVNRLPRIGETLERNSVD